MPSAKPHLALIGHRGARGLSPENTLVSFETAFALGVDAIEFDVGVTRDHVPVVIHSAALEGFLTRDADGYWLDDPVPLVKDLSLAALQSFDIGRIRPHTPYAERFAQQQPCDGARIPTLQDVVQAFKQPGRSHLQLAIELKINAAEPSHYHAPEIFVPAVLRVLEQAHVMHRCQIKSFDWQVLQLVQALAPGLPTAYLSCMADGLPPLGAVSSREPAAHTPADIEALPRRVHALGGHIWSCDHHDITPPAVALAHALGLLVWAWTANDPEDIKRLIAAGVDGIISDYPDRLRAVAGGLGLPLPPAAPALP